MPKIDLPVEITVQQKNQAAIDYLLGATEEELKDKYSLTDLSVITNHLNASPETRTEIEKKYFALQVARQSTRIVQMQDKIMDVFDSFVEDASTSEDKFKFLDSLRSLYNESDKIKRLNAGEATEISKNTNTNITYDIAEIVKSLKTPEDKKRFLLDKITNVRNKANIDG